MAGEVGSADRKTADSSTRNTAWPGPWIKRSAVLTGLMADKSFIVVARLGPWSAVLIGLTAERFSIARALVSGCISADIYDTKQIIYSCS